jgi:hypothetical protein
MWYVPGKGRGWGGNTGSCVTIKYCLRQPMSNEKPFTFLEWKYIGERPFIDTNKKIRPTDMVKGFLPSKKAINFIILHFPVFLDYSSIIAIGLLPSHQSPFIK